jgi:DAK2 domain fusion protein YloV
MTMLEVIDGAAVRRWYRLAADALAQTRAAIDALNVFPVPDADTGTNLHLTLISAAEAVDALPETASPAQIWEAAAHGAMVGACGNSGIIISQLLRGLSDVCAAADPCDGQVVADALAHAAVIARAAVSRPVEGTVLTVADAAARAAALTLREAGLAGVVLAAAAGAREALAATVGQLDVLAASGVVDAGAAGLCVLLDVLAATITGTGPLAYEVPAATGHPELAPCRSSGYEVTYLLEAGAEPVELLRGALDSLGNSVVIVGGEQLWNVHVHLADAGAAIEAGLRAGRPHRITVTYLGVESPGGRTVLAITDGAGPASLLRGAGARVITQDGGSGPAAPALIAAVRQSGSEVVILPNGRRIAALAKSAAARLVDEGLAVAVIPARSPLQALAAMAVHDPERSFDADVAAMGQAAAGMRYGSVIMPGENPAGQPADGPAELAAGQAAELAAGQPAELTAGQPADLAGVLAAGLSAGLVGDAVTVSGPDPVRVAIGVADALLAGDAELVTLMAAGEADSPLAVAVAGHVRHAWPAAEVVCYGGGPVALLIGAE